MTSPSIHFKGICWMIFVRLYIKFVTPPNFFFCFALTAFSVVPSLVLSSISFSTVLFSLFIRVFATFCLIPINYLRHWPAKFAQTWKHLNLNFSLQPSANFVIKSSANNCEYSHHLLTVLFHIKIVGNVFRFCTNKLQNKIKSQQEDKGNETKSTNKLILYLSL